MNSGVLFPTTNVIDTYVYRALIERKYQYVIHDGCIPVISRFVIVMLSNWIVRRVDKDRALFFGGESIMTNSKKTKRYQF